MQEVLDRLEADEASLVLVFFGCNHRADVVARVLDSRTQDRGVGGTTAGEITTSGFATGGITGISLHGEDIRAAVEVVPQLQHLSLIPLVHLPHQLARRIDRRLDELDPERHLWISLIDGLSNKEDLIVPFFVQSARRAPLVGASLSDGHQYRNVRLVHHGRVYRDAAALILLEYPHGFVPLYHSHLEFSDQWLTVTRTGAGGRLIETLDGEPARDAYARALGLAPDEVTAEVAARHPLGYRFRGRPFACSIHHPRPDGSLVMGHSVQNDERLNILVPGGLVERSQEAISQAISQLRAQQGGDCTPQGLLLFNCYCRYLEARQDDALDELFEALNQAPVCGFNSYGEQYASMHLNHSLTGIVFA